MTSATKLLQFFAIVLALMLDPAGMIQPIRRASAATEVFAPMKYDEIRSRVLSWLKDQAVSDDLRGRVEQRWPDTENSPSIDRSLDVLIQSFAIVDRGVAELVQECNSISRHPVTPRPELLNHPERSPFLKANLGLYYGRYLVERRLFDEAWDILKGLDSRDVVDPASLFFFRAVAAQGTLEVKPALNALDQLLKNTEGVPVRFSAAATLMQSDLKSLQEKSLGEVARLMSDSERRLELGRAGEKVQSVQERIISNLDELIKKMEQQQSGGGGGGGGEGSEEGSGNNPTGPAEDSSIKGSEAPGEVDKKDFEKKGNWGNLPPKELAKAKNDLNTKFPSHYENAIDKYTKKLSTRNAKRK